MYSIDFKGLDIFRVLAIAKICHETNRLYCESIGDRSQTVWEGAENWQQESAVKGVILHLTGDHGPEASHESWMKEKIETGWVYGTEKNPEKKTHPCMVTFKGLPKDQQRKDVLFRNIVHAFKD